VPILVLTQKNMQIEGFSLYSISFTDIFVILLLNRSSASNVAIGSGLSICPRGYILALDTPSASAAPRLGQCTQCSAGTYSLNPLYGGRVTSGGGETVGESESPKCLACAAGGVCLGGDKVLGHTLAC
jgi:hypothetical protein